MPERQTGASNAGEEQRGGSQWTKLLQATGARLVPLVVSASALLGFVAFAGAVIVWTRFFAVKVPPDQVVTAVPRSELVATGSSLLLLFGFFGVLAVLATYLLDRGGRATPGMARGLLALLVAEGVTAIVIQAGWGSADAWGAVASFLLPLSLIFVGTFLDQFTAVEDTLQARDREREAPRPRPLYSAKDAEGIERPLLEWRQLVLVAPAVVLVGVLVALMLVGLPWPVRALLLGVTALALVFVLGLALWAIAWIHSGLKDKWTRWEGEEAGKERREKAAERTREQEIAAAEKAVRKARRKLRSIRETTWADTGPGGAGSSAVPSAEQRVEQVLRGHEEEARKLRAEDEALEGSGRRNKPRSYNLQFKVAGMIVGFPLAGIAVAVPAVVLDESWVAGALFAAVALTVSLWRIAALPKRSFHWFGLAVFISVPLFGTLTLMARNIDDPQVQPVALIRSTDGPDEAIQGLYVTEGHDRVYFATVATEGCTDELRGGSGRLLWVPKEEVVAMSVGPLQSVEDAARASLEMAYALTPAVETPSGTAVSLRAEAEQAEAEALAEGDSERVPRLENTGPAVRPTFGLGISLEPESAAPNAVVTLSMSAPNEDVDGFGETRDGRNLRVGGIAAAIVKGRARRAERSEFVTTVAGEVLPLDKKGVYGWSGTDYVSWTQELGNAYVRLDPEAGVTRTLGGDLPGREARGPGDAYLRVTRFSGSETPDEVSGSQKVELRDGEPVEIKSELLRQAWGESSIRFRVPESSTTGAIEVECGQLAGQPLLQVERPPEANVSARMLSSGAILLDSRGSSDDGEIVARDWTVNEKPRFGKRAKGRGKERVGRATAEFDPPPRLGVHHVRLTVEDADEETDTASLYLVRVPGSEIAPEVLASTQSSLVKLMMEAEIPTEAHVAGHARVGSGRRLGERSGEAGSSAIARLLSLETAKRAEFEDHKVPVIASAFGDRCRLLGPNASQELHVDIFLFTEGFKFSPPRHCRHHDRIRRTWSAKAPSQGASPGFPQGRRSTS
jgi:hypothetical protein